MKVLKWVIICASVFGIPLQADTIRLVNAPVDAVTAYFSQLTGNAYILDFMPAQKIQILKEVSGTENIHALFVELIENLGGKVQKTSDKTFKIYKKPDQKIKQNIVDEKTTTPKVSLQRIYLDNKISKDGIGELIRTVSSLQGLTVISDESNINSILISGGGTSIQILKDLINTLDPIKVQKKSNKELIETVISESDNEDQQV